MNDKVIVGVGTYCVSDAPNKLICLGLGSCVAIALYDTKHRLGGLAHAMLPSYNEGRDSTNPPKYVDAAIYLMVDDIIEKGGRKKTLEAKVVGGSQMFSFVGNNTMDIGRRNIESAWETLKEEGIPIVASDVGGRSGRTISFDMKTGIISLRGSGAEVKEL